MDERSKKSIFSPPFPIGVWWVDDKGAFHPAEDVDESFDGIFYRHLGQVKVEASPPKIIVNWDIKEVVGNALPEVIHRLSESRSYASVHLRFFYFGWVEERYVSVSSAIDRINQIQSFRNVEILHSTYIEKHDLEKARVGTPLIRRGIQLWERTSGWFDRLSRHKCGNYMSHVLQFRLDDQEDHLIFSHIGSRSTAARVCGRGWPAKALHGRSDMAMPPMNEEFDRLVSASYQSVFISGVPHFDHVRAILHVEGMDPFWISYERLITRNIRQDGTPVVVSLVNRTQNVSIPLAGGP